MKALQMEVPDFATRPEDRRNMLAFWLLGLLNNSAYVIMVASANGISAAAVGLVFLCAVVPGICLKASAPYWFHRVKYSTRIVAAAFLMVGSYTTVAGANGRRSIQLIGVVLSSLQGSLGEASCLALTSHYNSQASITMWSSGTGFAGVFGYAWVAFLHVAAGYSFSATLLAANSTAIAWLATYFLLLEPPEGRAKQVKALVRADENLVGAAMEAMGSGAASSGGLGMPFTSYAYGSSSTANNIMNTEDGGDVYTQRYTQEGEEDFRALLLSTSRQSTSSSSPNRSPRALGRVQSEKTLGKNSKASRMTAQERLKRTLSLWPYTIPLFIVYFAEYAMQSGAWAAIGFPVTDTAARQKFYIYSNWCYQAGVFLSRSSGMMWQAERRALWIMPVLQFGWLIFFLANAVQHFWYNWGLLAPCFITGLLGGAVYVNAFTLIAREVEPQYREFSLAAASIADSAGIAVADVAGILIQGCLFKTNGLQGADFKC